MLLAAILTTRAGAEPPVPRSDDDPLTVCVMSFHGEEEPRVFKDHLPPADFDVVDLSPHLLATPTPGPAADRPGPAPWLVAICEQGVRCDVMVYSAEFAGSFFGKSGKALSLGDMEEAACLTQCDGLFHTPHEVFLLGCNTLATKSEDTRTPDEYRRVLLEHGFDQASAERVVGFRYGPLGPSFREAVRRVFMDVPRIYGFSSVAPIGQYTAPRLEKYFRSTRDYRRHLDETNGDTSPNKRLLAAFKGTGLVQTSGLMRTDVAAEDRHQICRLYDEGLSVAHRLGIVRELVGRKDFLAFVPTIQTFISRHPSGEYEDHEGELFEEIQRSEAARQQVLELAHSLDVSALQLELAYFAFQMDWMSPDAFRGLAIDGARELLARPLTSEVVDIMCEISKHQRIGDAFTSDDVPGAVFRHPEGIRLIECLAPADPRMSIRLADHLNDEDVAIRQWSGYALSRRLPLEDAVLLKLVEHVNDPPEVLGARVEWIFQAQRPISDEVREQLASRDPELAETLRRRDRRPRRPLW
jgi:hypothetical protein